MRKDSGVPEHTSWAALEPPRVAEASPEGLEDVTGNLGEATSSWGPWSPRLA